MMPYTHHTVTYRLPQSGGVAERTIDVHASPDEISQFVEQGYLVREALLTPDLLSDLRETMNRQIAKQDEPSSGAYDGLFLRHLFYRDIGFAPLLYHEPIISVPQALLGPLLQTRLSARVTFPGKAGQQTVWHSHQKNYPDPLPPFPVFLNSVDVLIYLDDVNEANGSLGVVPGSHRRSGWELPPDTKGNRPDEVVVTFPAGSGVFLHNNLWHRGRPSGENSGLRRMLALTYTPEGIKNVNDGNPPEDDHIFREMIAAISAEARESLGLTNYPR